jgi:S-formylglutathione hydrolase FrmB
MSINLCSLGYLLLYFLLADFAMASCFEIKSATKVFDGSLIRFSHMSDETKTTMTCSVFLPHLASDPEPKKCATLMYLSGLTCTDENVCQKSGIFRILSQHQVIPLISMCHRNNFAGANTFRVTDGICCT